MTMKLEEMATRTIFDCIAVILIASRTAGMYTYCITKRTLSVLQQLQTFIIYFELVFNSEIFSINFNTGQLNKSNVWNGHQPTSIY